MTMFRRQNAEQIQNTKTASKLQYFKFGKDRKLFGNDNKKSKLHSQIN
jgi:hypothetical protein